MMGVGGGSVMIPALVLLLGMEQQIAQGTSLLAMIPIGLAAALAHHRLGQVRHELLWGLIPGAIAGSYLGGSAANLLPAFYLRLLFAVVLAATGLNYLRRRPSGG